MKHLMIALLATALSAPALAARPGPGGGMGRGPGAGGGPGLGRGPGLGLGAAASPEVRQLRQEIAALRLDRLLNLTPEQARTLAPVLREGLQLKEQIQAEEQKRQPAIAKALTAVRDDLRRDGTVSEASRDALRQAQRDPKLKTQLMEARGKLKDIRQRIAAVLTPEQRQALRGFDARPLAGIGNCPDCPWDGQGPGRGKGRRGGKMGKGKGGGAAPLVFAMTPEFVSLVEARAR